MGDPPLLPLPLQARMAAARRVRVLVCTEIVGLQEAAAAAVRRRLGATVAVDWLERPPASLKPGGTARKELLEAEVLLADPGAVVGVIDDAEKLRWMQSTWAGVNVLFSDTTKRDFVCTRIAGFFGPLMSEYSLGYILLLERRLLLARAQQDRKEWSTRPFTGGTRPLSGLTLGLLGCGDIGKDIARSAKALGLKTAAFKRDISAPVEGVDLLTDDATAVLRASDFLVNTLPSTPATRGLLSGDALKACAGDARAPGRPTIFINVGRGDIMDEASILHALESGWIDHAVLDVFPVEPLPKCETLS